MARQPIHLQETIPQDYAQLRLDQALAKLFPQFSRTRLTTWLKAGQITVNDHIVKAKTQVTGGEVVVISASHDVLTEWEPQAIPIDVIFEDESLLVVNKPAGLVVHPGKGNPDKTLVNALLHHCPALISMPRGGIIHRLDKDTTGLMVVAKTLPAHTHLVNLLKQRSIKRTYVAIVNGVLISGGTIETYMGRHPRQRLKMAVTDAGKQAVTHYRIMERFREHSCLNITLETGRTHQIRVHMAYIQHPIVGDKLYGGRLKIPKSADEALQGALRGFQRQALHALRLELVHPISKQVQQWEAPIAQDMASLLALLRTDIQAHDSRP